MRKQLLEIIGDVKPRKEYKMIIGAMVMGFIAAFLFLIVVIVCLLVSALADFLRENFNIDQNTTIMIFLSGLALSGLYFIMRS